MAQHRSSDGLLRIVLIVVGAVVLLPFLMMALMMPFMWGMGGWGGMMGGWSGGMMDGTTGYGVWGWGMMLVWFLVMAGVGFLLYRFVTQSGPATTDPALEELRMQYARGELTDEEFEERQQRLARDE